MSLSSRQFGLIVAYLIPGFVGLVGLAPLVPLVAQWLKPVHDGALGFGPPLYTLLAATTMSQIINCFRWVLLDQFHSWCGLRPTATDFSQLHARIDGFDYLVQNHYRYYQFAGNMLLAIVWAYGINRILKTSPSMGFGTDLGVVILVLVLFAASRDALAKYYHRTDSLLGTVAEKGSPAMYNGVGHHEGSGADKKPSPESKPEVKNESTSKPAVPTTGAKNQSAK